MSASTREAPKTDPPPVTEQPHSDPSRPSVGTQSNPETNKDDNKQQPGQTNKQEPQPGGTSDKNPPSPSTSGQPKPGSGGGAKPPAAGHDKGPAPSGHKPEQKSGTEQQGGANAGQKGDQNAGQKGSQDPPKSGPPIPKGGDYGPKATTLPEYVGNIVRDGVGGKFGSLLGDAVQGGIPALAGKGLSAFGEHQGFSPQGVEAMKNLGEAISKYNLGGHGARPSLGFEQANPPAGKPSLIPDFKPGAAPGGGVMFNLNWRFH